MEERIVRWSWMRFWIFKCFCWNEFERCFKGIKRKKDCWCRSVATRSNGAKTHWLRYHRYYNIYRWIMSRCYNEKNSHYSNYWWRWISFYWKGDIKWFINWMDTNLPDIKPDESIDRINVNWNYEPWNLRWADHATQANNKTNNTIIEYEGVQYTLAQLQRKTWVNSKTLYSRYKRWIRDGEICKNMRSEINLLDREILCFNRKILIRVLVDKNLIPRWTLYDWYRTHWLGKISEMVESRIKLEQI